MRFLISFQRIFFIFQKNDNLTFAIKGITNLLEQILIGLSRWSFVSMIVGFSGYINHIVDARSGTFVFPKQPHKKLVD